MKYDHVMIDLETLGTKPGSVILSIGAVAFNAEQPETEWTTYNSGPILRRSCYDAGLVEDVNTVAWWRKQIDAEHLAGGVDLYNFFDDTTNSLRSMHIAVALTELRHWFPNGASVWSNGANFDGVLLRCAYEAVNVSIPWAYYNEQCFRTMKRQFVSVAAPEFVGTRHDALTDALHQTRYLQVIFARIKEAGL